MVALYVMRHAKSDWTVSGAGDFERPLNKRGMKDVPRVTRALQGTGLLPQRVITSPAARALATAGGIASGLTPVPELVPDERIYHAGPHALSAVVAELGSGFGCVMAVGHNPGLEEWIEMLCGAAVRLPTAGLARIELEIGDWTELKGARGELQWLVTPRLLKGMGVRQEGTRDY